MSSTATSRSYSYSLLTFVIDEFRQASIPVGVVLWSADPNSARIRIVGEREKIKGLKSNAYAFLRIAKGKIQVWQERGTLPYAKEGLRPGTDEWWRHASKLLVHGVRLSEPRAIDCRDPEKETELLFEALVKPSRPSKERRKTIDWEITRTLGTVAKSLEKGSVAGFKGRPVPVKRYASTPRELMVIEGVNLASAAAEQDTDALVSRLLRIKEANGAGGNKGVTAYVGYLASPTGLNGEAALLAWIQQKAQAKVFDLVTQADLFSIEVQKKLSELQVGENQSSFSS